MKTKTQIMKLTFQQGLDGELLRSERKRTIILMSIFSFAAIFRIINASFLKPNEEDRLVESFPEIWLFPVVIILFELFSFFYINNRIKTNRQGIPTVLQYLNTAFEICLPSIIIFLIARQYPLFNVLQSPVVFIYFIFIILSTLRLNFRLSLFCGLLSSLSYAGFSIFLYNQFSSSDAGRAFILLFSGIAAGLVARQIRSGIDSTIREAQKRQKAENLFGQHIPAKVAEAMLENNGNFKSRRMNVAVLFIDIRDFTKFTAHQTPEEIVHYQNVFFTIVINTVSKHGGIVNQILGDGCMITFGAPLTMDNPSLPAVQVATELLKNIETAVCEGTLPPTRIGIGIHFGEAVTGNIGNNERQQYSITGSVVIMASRIEQLNKEFHSQVLISGDVYHAVAGNGIVAELYNDICLKGFDEPVKVYKLA